MDRHAWDTYLHTLNDRLFADAQDEANFCLVGLHDVPNGLSALAPIEQVDWIRAKASPTSALRSVAEDYADSSAASICSRTPLLIGSGDGNEFIFLLPGEGPRCVCNWEHETGVALFDSFGALMRSH